MPKCRKAKLLISRPILVLPAGGGEAFDGKFAAYV
jgi:hypothetical protein